MSVKRPISFSKNELISKAPYPYNCFNIYRNNNLDKDSRIPLVDIEKEFNNDISYNEFLVEAHDFIDFTRNSLKSLEYAEYYCNLDVIILQKCMIKFNTLCKEIFGADIHKVLTISSLANNYMKDMGVYREFSYKPELFSNIEDLIYKYTYNEKGIPYKTELDEYFSALGDIKGRNMYLFFEMYFKPGRIGEAAELLRTDPEMSYIKIVNSWLSPYFGFKPRSKNFLTLK
jgi:hypothetical protein